MTLIIKNKNKKLIKSIFSTIIFTIISIFCSHKISITHDPLFNDINALPYQLLLFICIITIYINWLFYADYYSKDTTNNAGIYKYSNNLIN